MNQLSGGERQRVVLARALTTEARILLLDEPTANLDLAHQALLFRLIKSRCETSDCAAIVITHDINLASEFADEIILLKNGAISVERRARNGFDDGKSATGFQCQSSARRKSVEREKENYNDLLRRITNFK